MADFRLGRLKFKWRGDWAASTAYVIDDIVKFGANSYVCTTNHTSIQRQNLHYSGRLSNWDLHTEGLKQRRLARWNWANNRCLVCSNDVVKYGNTVYRCTTAHCHLLHFDFIKWALYSEGLNFEDTWSSQLSIRKVTL